MNTEDPELDLHVHTTASDGTLELDEVPAAARRAGVDTVAITDHDRIHPGLDEPVTTRDGVRVVRAVELRVEDEETGMRVDLLGYGVRETRALRAELDRLQRDRIERARAIIDCVEESEGVTLDIDPTEGVGRPHIARAIEASESAYDYQGAFDTLIGSDHDCYRPRNIAGFTAGVELLREACPVVSLAHPFRYPDVGRAFELARTLGAIERYYAYGRPVDTARIERTVREADLLRTGGSDAHDRTLGRAGLAGREAEVFLDRLDA